MKRSAPLAQDARRSDARSPSLTSRQREVMTLLANGLSNREIGERLGVSEQAVKAIVSRLLAKFRVRNRTGLIRAAIADMPAARSDEEEPVDELADAGIVLFDARGHVLLMNDRGAALARTYNSGKSMSEQMQYYAVRDERGAPIAPEDTPLGRALAGETVLGARFMVRVPGDDTDTLLRTNVSPLRDSRGRITGAVSLFWRVARTST